MGLRERRSRIAYERITDELRDLIRAEFEPGDQLPAQNDLCQQFRVGVGTVVNAMEALQREGVLVRQHGRGTFVTDPGAPTIGIVNDPSAQIDPKGACEKVLAEAAAQGRIRYKRYSSINGDPILRTLADDGVRGLITFSITDEDLLRQVTKRGIRIISTDWLDSIPGLDIVGMDSFRAGEQAAEQLIEAGHTRIAYIGFQPWNRKTQAYIGEADSEMRLAGIQTSLLRHGITPNPAHVARLKVPSPFQERQDTFSALDAYKHLFDRPDPPTALVYGAREPVERDMLPILAANGRVVPRDVSAVTIDWLERRGNLTTVGCRLQDIISRAVELLLVRLRMDKREPTCRILVDTTVQDHGTIAPPPGTAR